MSKQDVTGSGNITGGRDATATTATTSGGGVPPWIVWVIVVAVLCAAGVLTIGDLRKKLGFDENPPIVEPVEDIEALPPIVVEKTSEKDTC